MAGVRGKRAKGSFRLAGFSGERKTYPANSKPKRKLIPPIQKYFFILAP
jgi:hypothetical protein